MANLLSEFWIGDENFGINLQQSHPAVYLFGFQIYIYALCIVTGMCLAIVVAGYYFKKRGYDPYDIALYAIVVIPIGVLGARAYVYIFPWSDSSGADWSTYFHFREGGLGIYGGVIMGYLAAYVLSKIKKHDFRIVTDSLLPGVMLAQSLGRWGNFANQEAYGKLITNAYDGLAHANSGIFSKFNGYAVWIDSAHAHSSGAGWYQATFFYESMCTLIGFIICFFLLTRLKKYRLGWCTAFYGIYYGTVRLIIEGMRTDSLYLYIGTMQTDIKISQLVSIFAIALGLLTLSNIYRKQLHALYSKLFRSERDEVSKSRWILLALSVAFAALAVVMFVLSAHEQFGQSKFIVGFFAAVLAVYCGLGVWSCHDRLQIYCPDCGNRAVPVESWQTLRTKHFVAVVCYAVIMGALVLFGLFSLVYWGVVRDIPNGYVLAVVCYGTAIALLVFRLLPELRSYNNAPASTPQTQFECACGKQVTCRLNKFLLFVFPPKVYKDYTVDKLQPWVDPEPKRKRRRKAN